MNQKEELLIIYETAYKLERYAIDNKIYTESELWDIRYKVDKKILEDKNGKNNTN